MHISESRDIVDINLSAAGHWTEEVYYSESKLVMVRSVYLPRPFPKSLY